MSRPVSSPARSAPALRLLGGARAIPLGAEAGALEISDALDAGLPASALADFQRATALPAAELARLIGVSTKSVGRYLAAPKRRLPASVSDRLYRTARLVELAARVLGDRKDGLGWLRTPQSGLGGRRPLSLLGTDPGAAEVESELLRIEHGFLA